MKKILCFNVNDKEYKFKDKKEAYKFIEKNTSLHKDLFDKYITNKDLDNIKSLYQYIFNFYHSEGLKYNGKCVICSNNTEFNNLTRKYNRLCSKECINKYKEDFKQRMNKTYGRDYYIQDASAIKNMLNNRSITKKYVIGNYTYNAVGNWEYDFLDFMFKILKCHPADLLEAPFVIPYEYNGVKSNYYPDFYMPSINLLIEIKAENNHYEKRDREQNEAKVKAGKEFMSKRNGHFFIIYNKNYSDFLHFLDRIIEMK